MGKTNVVTKKYMQDNARFADACNFYLFHGEQVINPENLTEQDVTELALPKGLKDAVAIEKVRDILKGCCIKTADGVTYLVVGIENQSDIHYAMVIRNMLYDALNYSSQVEVCAKQHRQKKDVTGAEFLSGFAKTDTLHPVITLTIYWNYGSWDEARCLHDMLDVKDKKLLKYVPDYRLNLIVPEEIEDFEKFGTEMGAVLEFIKSTADVKELDKAIKKNREHWTSLSIEAVELLNICLDTKLEIAKESGKGEGNNVCKAIEDLKELSRIEGKIEGEERLSKLMQVLATRGYQFAEVLSMTSSTEQREKLYEEYGIA